MDRLELVVRERDAQQPFERPARREIPIEPFEALCELQRRRWHEAHFWTVAADRADPHLCIAELAGPLLLAAHAAHQVAMQVAQQIDRQRTPRRQRGHARAKRATVVLDLEVVVDASPLRVVELVHERGLQRRLGAFDTTRQHGFARAERPQEQLRARQRRDALAQAADQCPHFADRVDRAAVHREPERQRRWHEGQSELTRLRDLHPLARRIRQLFARHRISLRRGSSRNVHNRLRTGRSAGDGPLQPANDAVEPLPS